MKRILVLLVLFGALLPGFGFAQQDRSAEISSLLKGLDSTSQRQRVDAAKIISRSGLQDQALYEKIAELLKTGYRQPFEKDHTDEMAWLCKALAASGDSQYRPLLEEVAESAPSTKLQRYARQSTELLETYAQRSQILNATEGWDPELSAEENRIVGMLKADDTGLKKEAAKMLVRQSNSKEKVFDAAAAALLQMSQNFSGDSAYVDSMAWLCKALAASGQRKYVADLEQIRTNTQSVKLDSYIAKALKALK